MNKDYAEGYAKYLADSIEEKLREFTEKNPIEKLEIIQRRFIQDKEPLSLLSFARLTKYASRSRRASGNNALRQKRHKIIWHTNGTLKPKTNEKGIFEDALNLLILNGAWGGNRTRTLRRIQDFKSCASTYSATQALEKD